MKNTEHKNRKSFKQWGQRFPVNMTLVPNPKSIKPKPRRSGPAMYRCKTIPYAPANILTQPGTSREVTELRDRNSRAIYVTARDGGIHRVEPKPWKGITSGKTARRHSIKLRRHLKTAKIA